MDATSKYVIKQGGCVTRDIVGETIIVPIRGQVGDLDSIYTLNEVGSAIWRLIDGQTSVAQIAEAVAQQYNIGVEQATQDVTEFLGSLETTGLISPGA